MTRDERSAADRESAAQVGEPPKVYVTGTTRWRHHADVGWEQEHSWLFITTTARAGLDWIRTHGRHSEPLPDNACWMILESKLRDIVSRLGHADTVVGLYDQDGNELDAAPSAPLDIGED